MSLSEQKAQSVSESAERAYLCTRKTNGQMETLTKTMQVTVPTTDAPFLRHLSGKMGWALRSVRTATVQRRKPEDTYYESPQFYDDIDAAERDIAAGKGVSVQGADELNALFS